MPAKRKSPKKKSTGMVRVKPPVMVGAGYQQHGRVGAMGKKKKKSTGMSTVAKAALDQKHTVAALGAAAAFGALDGQGQIPESLDMGGIGKEGVAAILAFAGGKFTKSKVLMHVATGLGSVAAYKMAFEATSGGKKASNTTKTDPAVTTGIDYDDW